ncbi:MAG: hypothetical protein ACE5G2_04020 [Candidatus Krumholzibacteriia bacterium]
MCISKLNPRDSETYEAIRNAEAQHPEGVTPIALAFHLGKPEHGMLQQMEAIIRAHPDKVNCALSDLEAKRLAALAKQIEYRHHGRLREVAEEIADSFMDGEGLKKSDAQRLRTALHKALSNDVEKRVAELRQALPDACRGSARTPETVTRRRYRIVQDARLVSLEIVRGLGSLHLLFARPAWLGPVGYWESNAFWLAQSVLRSATATGLICTDDGRYLAKCTPVRLLRTPELRAQVERIVRISSCIQKIFELFYEPERSPLDKNYVMSLYAKPYAGRVVRYLNEARNAVLQAVNDLFVPFDFEEYPLIVGCELFPDHDEWIPPGSVPDHAVVMSDDEICCEFEALRRIAYDLRKNTRLGPAEQWPTGPPPPESRPGSSGKARSVKASPPRKSAPRRRRSRRKR